jgi:elongation factor Ts
LQIAASAPICIREEDLPPEALEREKEIASAKAREEGKPEAIISKIVEGSLEKYKNEVVLLRQMYIRDESIIIQDLVNQTVVSLGENVVIRRFVRWELGTESD